MRLPEFRIEVLEQIMGVGLHIDIVFVGFDSYHMSVNNEKWFLLQSTSILDLVYLQTCIVAFFIYPNQATRQR